MFVLIKYLCFVSSSTATRIQLSFHSNLLCTYTSHLKQISSSHQYLFTKRNIYWNGWNHQFINFINTMIC